MYVCMLYVSCEYKSFLTSLMANCGSDNNNSVTIIPIITVSKNWTHAGDCFQYADMEVFPLSYLISAFACYTRYYVMYFM